MNRSHPARILILIAGLAVFCLAFTIDVIAAPGAQRGGPLPLSDYSNPQCDVTVTGSDSDPFDAIAVNTAVNGPHPIPDVTVCLVGTFDFGEASFVAIDPPEGVETLRITGINGATIKGGLEPLRVVGFSEAQQLTIDHIRFEAPSFTAITISGGNGLVQISDNIVEGVQSRFIEVFGGTFREGITVTSFFGDIDGEILIQDNWVDGGSYHAVDDAELAVSIGIGVFSRVQESFGGDITADVEISGNTVLNWSGTGIASLFPFGGGGDMLVEHNTVEPGTFANDAPGLCVANGIQLIGDAATVRNNSIDMVPALTGSGFPPGCTAGIILSTFSEDNTVSNNQVRGAGRFGLLLANSSGNTFIGNHLAAFAPTGAHIFLNTGSNNNTFVGYFGTVIDNGTGNTFTGPGGP